MQAKLTHTQTYITKPAGQKKTKEQVENYHSLSRSLPFQKNVPFADEIKLFDLNQISTTLKQPKYN